MNQQTHPNISVSLVGEALELGPQRATAKLQLSSEMAADERGLVHGGFTFGLADFAAMLAVNDPNVVLGAAECRFLAPTTVGQTLVATAAVQSEKGKKRVVDVSVAVAPEGQVVFTGSFVCYVLAGHVLDG